MRSVYPCITILKTILGIFLALWSTVLLTIFQKCVHCPFKVNWHSCMVHAHGHGRPSAVMIYSPSPSQLSVLSYHFKAFSTCFSSVVHYSLIFSSVLSPKLAHSSLFYPISHDNQAQGLQVFSNSSGSSSTS